MTESDKPKLARSILRYFWQGDYDLIAPDEYYAIALYLKGRDLVEIEDEANPGDIVELLRSLQAGRIDDEKFEDAVMETGGETMARFILRMYQLCYFDKFVIVPPAGTPDIMDEEAAKEIEKELGIDEEANE